MLPCAVLSAQDIDTTGNDGADTLEAAVFVRRQAANFISKTNPVRTEVISAAGLCKMACCNLAESFENSASVTVGYSDAVTGARQIRLLGLSGVYTQMLDENRPVMRGLPSPFGLSYVPGQWLESIQIAKGPSSVINGLEAITGQINMEHRKPTLEQPLFINAAIMSDLKADFNIASSLQIDDNWSTVLLGHVSGSGMEMDHNHDGFMDDPKSLQLNFANRWLYYAASGVQVRFGVRALRDTRLGGEMGAQDYWQSGKPELSDLHGEDRVKWSSGILNQGVNGYVKVGVPLNEDNTMNIAFVGDYTYHQLDSYFGLRDYNGSQHSGFGNLLFQDEISESHKFTVGLSGQYDRFNEMLGQVYGQGSPADLGRTEYSAGAFGEYTYHYGDKFSAIVGLRGDWNNLHGFLFAPRLNLKYSFADDMVVARVNAGRGFRSPNIIVDNIGILSTGRTIEIEDSAKDIESAWTIGGNATVYLPIGESRNSYLSVDYFATLFDSQLVVDQEFNNSKVLLYGLEGRSYTHTWQLDFSVEPIERFTIMTTFRYTDSKQTQRGKGLVERPLTSRYKGVLNLQYATRLNKWIFDFTVSLNGPSRVYDFMLGEKDAAGNLLYPNGMSPVYPMLYAQITRKFKGWDVYIGGENLTNYRQKYAILGASDPFSEGFNASAVWGPLMGIKVYAGFRFTLWKY